MFWDPGKPLQARMLQVLIRQYCCHVCRLHRHGNGDATVHGFGSSIMFKRSAFGT
jgi:hypothetical protein